MYYGREKYVIPLLTRARRCVEDDGGVESVTDTIVKTVKRAGADNTRHGSAQEGGSGRDDLTSSHSVTTHNNSEAGVAPTSERTCFRWRWLLCGWRSLLCVLCELKHQNQNQNSEQCFVNTATLVLGHSNQGDASVVT